MNLNEILNINTEEFDSEDKCIAYLETMRWPNGVRCPTCGNRKISRIHAKGRVGKVRLLYQCLDKECRYQFSATTGTIFHDSHLPLSKWFKAISLLGDSQEAIPTNQLRLILGIQYKTAQHVVERIREATQNGTIEARSDRKVATEVPAVVTPADLISSAELRLEISEGRHAANPIASKDARSSAVVNLFSMFTSMAHLTMKSPLFLANYLITKVSLDA